MATPKIVRGVNYVGPRKCEIKIKDLCNDKNLLFRNSELLHQNKGRQGKILTACMACFCFTYKATNTNV